MKAAEIFSSFYSKYKNSKLVIATHENADMDALASAYVLKKYFPNSQIAVPKKIAYDAENFAKKFHIKFEWFEKLNPKNFDGLIAVDTSSKTLLPSEKWKVLLIIDHHKGEPDFNSEYKIIDENAGATSQIVAEILPTMDAETSFVLAAGILSDTARFKRGDLRIFETFTKLLKQSKKTYDEVYELGEPEKPKDAKKAVLTALQRLEFLELGGYIVALSHVGTKESISAALLSEIADISFVASYKEDEKIVRISARARNHVKVRLNEVMKEVGTAIGGDGGGHEKAAGAQGKASEQEALKKCVEILRKHI
ncbi:MAG: DHHA1 domain-containing protein [Candidatus Anstonellales archaeon]